MKTETKLKKAIKLHKKNNIIRNKIFRVFDKSRLECYWMDENRYVDFYCNHPDKENIHCNIFDCPLIK